jgi:dipeptidyl aminopeptidase/acylaminoacyl peptidase
LCIDTLNNNVMHTKILLLAAAFSTQFEISAQENLSYQVPSKTILDLADYEPAPSTSLSSDKSFMLLSYRNTYKTLDELGQEDMRLGGLRVNPVTNISSTVTYITNLKLKKISDKTPTQVKGLPTNAKITNISFAPDEKRIAFTHTTATGVELWLIDVATAQATRLTKANLNANMGSPFIWYRDGSRLLVSVLPAKRQKLIDASQSLPAGPIISVSDGKKAPNRTYQDLLKNPTDEINFEILVTAELHEVDLKGKTKLFKPADMYAGKSFSPDGNYLMITTLAKPFSYFVPWSRFAQKVNVYDKKGTLVSMVNDVPLAEVLPKGFMSVRKGRRDMSWRADAPATLFFVEALDGGDAENKVDYRDELFLWEAPFKNSPKSFLKTPQRYADITWGSATLAIVEDYWYDTRNMKTYIVNPSNKEAMPRKIDDRNYQDVYADIGTFATAKNEYGRQSLIINEGNLYLIGNGFTKAGKFPFVDAFDIQTTNKKRLYQSTYTDKLESLLSFADVKKGEILCMLQSPSEYPNFYLRDINKKDDIRQITFTENPFSSLGNVHKEVVTYYRKDGVALSGTLYLPAGYDRTKKDKLPLLIWAYPREYKDKNSAGQNTASPNAFTFPSYGSFIYWVTKGYAVLDNASFPIVGEGTTEPNDNFLAQLTDNAEAAINAIDSMGYIDRKRVGIGGHSYGAFMTANLLTHTNLFACGIARSGAYNRTLTPFGFQSEQRNYWEVPQIYNTMSPFATADKMKTPLLLVHGEADNNPGTFTLQTERYFQALKGLGAPVRMVILPKESHGYAARENILHLLWEQEQFLDKYLK